MLIFYRFLTENGSQNGAQNHQKGWQRHRHFHFGGSQDQSWTHFGPKGAPPPILDDFWSIFGWFLIDFGMIFKVFFVWFGRVLWMIFQCFFLWFSIYFGIDFEAKIDRRTWETYQHWQKQFYENECLGYTKHSFPWFRDMILEAKIDRKPEQKI